MKQVAIETLDAPEIQTWTPQAKYSQPLPSSTSGLEPLILRAGFIGKHKAIGFLFVRKTKGGYKREEVEATPQNSANEKPRGFFQCLARLYGSNR